MKNEFFLQFLILATKLRFSSSMTPRFTTLDENEISEEPKVIEEAIDLQSATEEGVPIIMTWDLLSFNFKKLSLTQFEICSK